MIEPRASCSTWFMEDDDNYNEDCISGYNSDKQDSDEIDSDTEVLLFNEVYHRKNEFLESEEFLPKLDCIISSEVLYTSTNDNEVGHLSKNFELSNETKNNLTKDSISNSLSCISEGVKCSTIEITDNGLDQSVPEVILISSDTDSDEDKLIQKNIPQNSNNNAKVPGDKQSSSGSDSEDVIYLDCDTDLMFNISDDVGNKVDLSLCEKSQKERDQGSWNVDLDDEYKSARQSARYHTNINVTCYNCQQKGHFTKSCPNPRKLPRCYLCSAEGHKGDTCVKALRLCSVCMQQHPTRRCYLLSELIAGVFNPCSLCNMIGHKDEDCPNAWRRFHRTLKLNGIIQHEVVRNKRIFCYNCGYKGHHGYKCNKRKMEQWMSPSWPFIVCPVSACSGKGCHKIEDNSSKKLKKKVKKLYNLRTSEERNQQNASKNKTACNEFNISENLQLEVNNLHEEAAAINFDLSNISITLPNRSKNDSSHNEACATELTLRRKPHINEEHLPTTLSGETDERIVVKYYKKDQASKQQFQTALNKKNKRPSRKRKKMFTNDIREIQFTPPEPTRFSRTSATRFLRADNVNYPAQNYISLSEPQYPRNLNHIPKSSVKKFSIADWKGMCRRKKKNKKQACLREYSF